MKIRHFITLLTLALGCFFAIPRAYAQAPAGGEPLQADRIQVIQQFLATFYPDLEYNDAQLQASWTRKEGQARGFEISIRNCFHGVVSQMRAEPIAPGARTPPAAPRLPACGEPQKALNASVEISWLKGIHIANFYSWGGMLTERLDSVLGEINRQINNGAADYPEALNAQQEREAIKILNAANPAYGPTKRAEFVKFVPVDALHRFTGCRLRPETAVFIVQSGNSLFLRWAVSDKQDFFKRSCTAAFEPFSGHLTRFDTF